MDVDPPSASLCVFVNGKKWLPSKFGDLLPFLFHSAHWESNIILVTAALAVMAKGHFVCLLLMEATLP